MKENRDDDLNSLRLAVVCVAIPFVLAVPPIIGWAIGNWLDRQANTSPYLMYLFIAIGIAAGVKEFYRIVRSLGGE